MSNRGRGRGGPAASGDNRGGARGGGQRGGRGSSGGGGGQGACYKCGNLGHMARECSIRQSYGEQGRGDFSASRGRASRGFGHSNRGGGRQDFGRSSQQTFGSYDPDALSKHLASLKLEPFEKATDNVNRNWVGKVGNRLASIVTNYVNVPQFGGNIFRQLKVFRVDLKRAIEGKQEKENTKIIEKRSLCRVLFWEFVERYPECFTQSKIKNKCFVYDDSHKLYSLIDLQFGKLELVLDATDELVSSNQTNPGKFILTIKKTSEEINILTVLNLLLTQNARCPLSNLNHVFCERDRIYNIYRNPIMNVDVLDLGPIQLLKGIRAIMKQGPEKYLANFDVCHTAFTKIRVDILEFYAMVKGINLTDIDRQNMRDYGMNFTQRKELKSLLYGLNLKTKEGDGYNWEPRYYRLTDVCEKETAHNTIIDYQGESLNIVDYYLRKYGYRIKYPYMPLILCGLKEKKLRFPIEVLQISERLQRIRQKLPEYKQALCTPFTTQPPVARFQDISRMMKDTMFREENGVQVSNDSFLDAFGVGIGYKLLEIEGRILPKPDMHNILGEKVQEMKPVFFTLLKIGRFGERDNATIDETIAKVIQGCKIRKMILQDEKLKETQEFGEKDLENEHLFDDYITTLVNKANRLPNNLLVIIVVVPESNDFVYNTVKTKCELAVGPNVGAMTQFLRLETLRKKVNDLRNPDPARNRVVDNIVRKINAKSGGINIKINQKFQLWAKFTDPNQPTLFIGVDVTHPSPGEEEIPSIAAVVGNIDLDGVKYGASVRRQERIKTNGQNIAQEPNTNKWPKNIIIFRDGVSESQFEMVRFDECIDAKRGCMRVMKELKIDNKPMPKFAIVVVQKRHSTRFWAKGLQMRESTKENLPPGTVVDRYITRQPIKEINYDGTEPRENLLGCDKKEHRCEKEFYLCSHQGLLGTSRPGRYVPIYDEMNLNADDAEQLAFALCYLYAPTSMPVSIPAPVYYAHKACYRARKHYASLQSQGLPGRIMGDPSVVQVHEKLANKMYFC